MEAATVMAMMTAGNQTTNSSGDRSSSGQLLALLQPFNSR